MHQPFLLLLLCFILITRCHKKFHKRVLQLSKTIHFDHSLCQTFHCSSCFIFYLKNNMIFLFFTIGYPFVLLRIEITWTCFPKSPFFTFVGKTEQNDTDVFVSFANKWFRYFLIIKGNLRKFMGKLVNVFHEHDQYYHNLLPIQQFIHL